MYYDDDEDDEDADDDDDYDFSLLPGPYPRRASPPAPWLAFDFI